jgi:hypothetical protein
MTTIEIMGLVATMVAVVVAFGWWGCAEGFRQGDHPADRGSECSGRNFE